MNRIPAGYEIVNSAELASLRRKAQAHDAYLWATKRMADRFRNLSCGADQFPPGFQHGFHLEGYRMALTDFAQLVKDAPME